MDPKTAILRARRGLREDRRLHAIAIASLTVAFLCLGATMLGLVNLSTLAEQWGDRRRMTVYLRDGAPDEKVQQLRMLLRDLRDVDGVEHVSGQKARRAFLDNANIETALDDLPADVFPASLEVTLAPGSTTARADAIAARLTKFGAVDDVESYRGWFARLDSLLTLGRGVAVTVALLITICVLAIVASTIRLAIANRREEIEVMKLCGATNGFVRGPFVAEGAIQGLLAAAVSVVLLLVGFVVTRDTLDATLGLLTGLQVRFLPVGLVVMIVVGGALIGALGSALSLRRYLTV